MPHGQRVLFPRLRSRHLGRRYEHDQVLIAAIRVRSGKLGRGVTSMPSAHSTPVFSFSYAKPVRTRVPICEILVPIMDLTESEKCASMGCEFSTTPSPGRSARLPSHFPPRSAFR